MEHGTYAGYERHRRGKSVICEPCRAAARIYWRAAEAHKKKLGITKQRKKRNRGTTNKQYNGGNALAEFRKYNPGLEPAIKAVYHDNATPEQKQRVRDWYSRAWGLEPTPTIEP